MIKFREQVPSIYPSASRDFQYLGWLIDIVLNSVKHNVDDLYDLPNTKSDTRLNELLAMTLGFKVKRNYDQKQLAALVAVLPRILKYKGTKIAVDIAGNALIAAAGATGDFFSEVADGELIATFPEGLVDITLFTDLLTYILPAGMTCRLIRATKVKHSPKPYEVAYRDSVRAKWIQDLDIIDEREQRVEYGLANMFSVPSEATLANFMEANGKLLLNTGLLDNNIIPAIDPSRFEEES